MDGRSTPDPPAAPAPRDRPDGGSAADLLWWYGEARQPRPTTPRRWPSIPRATVADALGCLAVSALCFSRVRRETLFDDDRGFYHQVPLGAPVLAVLLLNLVGLAALGFLGVQVVRRVRRRAGRRLAAFAATATLLVALNYVRITEVTAERWTEALGRPGLLALASLALGASLGWPGRSLRAVRGVAVAISPFALLTLVHTLWMFLEVAAGPAWPVAEPARLARTPPSLRRVVWLVLQALDQRTTFEARPAGLELPELDRLKRESLYAQSALPPAGTPEISMPALITGRPVVAASPVSPNDLDLTFTDGTTARWSALPGVFSRARTLGYDTAAIGWGLPYPRILGGSLGVAAFWPSAVHEQARGSTFGQILRNQWGTLVPPANVRRLRALRMSELGDRALRTAADDRFGLVLLHLPIPQPPGIYDAATGHLSAWNFARPEQAYLDNLALADGVIGALRRALDRARLDDRTWLVVSADRWWTGSPRQEGRVDHRVPFLVRPPSGGRTVPVDARFGTLATHDLILAILRGSIMDSREAAAWLAREAVTPPRNYTPGGRPIY